MPNVPYDQVSNGAPSNDWYGQFSANTDWKDTTGYDPGQWEAWHQEQNAKGGAQKGCPPNLPFTGRNGQCAAKPDDCPDGMHVVGTPGTCVPDGQGGGAGGQGGPGGQVAGGGWNAWNGGGAGQLGGAPQFNYTPFQAPDYGATMNDPGYQFRLKQGADLLQHSQAAQGMARTGGSLAGLMQYGQDAASTEYGNAFNRALQGWGANYQGQKDQFAPQYGAWQTMFGANEDRWRTMYGGDLSKYLQKEGNIYGLINTPPPSAPQAV